MDEREKVKRYDAQQKKIDDGRENHLKTMMSNFAKEDPAFVKAVRKLKRAPADDDEREKQMVALLLKEKEELTAKRMTYFGEQMTDLKIRPDPDNTVGLYKFRDVLSLYCGAK